MSDLQSTITTLRNLLDYDACRIANAEVQLMKKLPNWINTTSSVKLKTSLQKYLEFVEAHAKMLQAFLAKEEFTGIPLQSAIMQAFLAETSEKLISCTDSEVKDACLLSGIQLINHFKISAYGTAAAFATALGMEYEARIFHEAEVNEKQIDDRLSQLAEHEVNMLARTPIVLTL